MNFTIGDIEDPTCGCRMRNGQHGCAANVLIINHRPSIETTSDRDKTMTCQGMSQPFEVSLDTRAINRTQAQHGAQWLTISAPRIQDPLFGSKFRPGIKSIRLNRRQLIERTTSEGPYTAIVLNRTMRSTLALIPASTTVAVPPILTHSYFSCISGGGLTMCRRAAI